MKTKYLAILLLITVAVKAQPIANFTANPVAGCSPLLVNFTDQSTGNPTYWKWDLGNGTISYNRNPSTTYTTPGIYDVKLFVQNSTGTNTIIKRQFITVYNQPIVKFSASTPTGCSPLLVNFIDSSSTASGSINSWLWDFGDGTLSTQQHPSHTYVTSGSFNVSLSVGSTVGCRKSITKPYYIRINESPIADFSNTNPNNCHLPVAVTFNNLSTGSGALQFDWSFGDGGTSRDFNPIHNYSAIGNYTVRLIVTNSNGCRDTLIRNNSINIGSVHANFTNSAIVCLNSTASFSNLSSPNPLSSIWYFGDSSTSVQLNPTHTYTTAGIYSIKLVSNFGSCKDSIIKQITVNERPRAKFSTIDTASCSLPYTILLTNNSQNGVSYLWNFGDGSTSTATDPVHTYTSEGRFTITLITTNLNGCSDTISKFQIIKIQLPRVTIDSLPRSGCAPYTNTFRSRLISPQPAISYFWDFGDGTTSNLPNPTHTYDSGVFTIKLIVVTLTGCSDTVEVINGIKVGIRPVANFYATPLEVCASMPVNFFDQTRDTANRWMWYFGDGGTSTSQNPVYTYSDTGYFNVKLIAYNNGCPDTIIRDHYVHINPPIAKFTYTFDCSDEFRRVFKGDMSIGANSYLWNFGDGTTSTMANPVHIYSSIGAYDVSLTVYNITSGCESTKIRSLVVANEHADFNVSDTILCKYSPFSFNAINSNPAYIINYNWNFGDGSTGVGRMVTHSYNRSGNYNVTLVITDVLGCKDTMIKRQLLRVNGPTARFTSSAPGTCLLSQMQFIDSSFSDGINPINSWSWNFGDGTINTYTAPPFAHTYSAPGFYTISVTVTDSMGCSDMKTISNMVQITKPIAAFSTRDTLTCPGKILTFANASSGSSLSYFWNFGDGNTSTSASITHSYAADGIYTVRLLIRNQFGCEDSLIRNNYIRVTTGKALFTMSDSVSNCPPLVVNFTNSSINSASYTWDFGDGNSSQLVNPSHFYSYAGNYTVTLTAKGIGGCNTIFQKHITINGPSGTFSYTPIEGCSPLTVNFTATTMNTDSIIWDFSDGNTLTTSNRVVSYTYTIPGKYLPKMILRNSSGCQVIIPGTDTVRVHGVTSDFSLSQISICNAGQVQFTNNSTSDERIVNYKWYFGDGDSSTLLQPNHYYSISGVYYPHLIVTSESGCRDSIQSAVPIKIITAPNAVISHTANGCTPISIGFTSNITNPDTSSLSWNWNFGNGQTSSIQNPGNLIYTIAGDYNITLIVTNSLGCSDTTSTSISSFPIPEVNAGQDTVRCFGRTVALHASGATTYLWTPSIGLNCSNCSDPIASPDSSIIYSVKGTSVHGCISQDEVKVFVAYPFQINLSKGDTLCNGETAIMYAAGADYYSWTPSVVSMNTNNSVVHANPRTNTSFQVTGRDTHNCFSVTQNIPITVFPVPTVDAGRDVTINSGEMTDLIPVVSSDVTEVIWTPTGSTFRNNYPSISVRPRETTEYLVEVSNPGGCKARDNVTVFVTCNGSNVFIPNTFSPNGDGMNDIFFPRGRGLFSIKSMKIFSRWGEIMYERSDFSANNPTYGWDGTYKGKSLSPDIYVYVIEIVCENNTSLIYKGNVALVK